MWLAKLLVAVRGRLWKQPDQPAAQDKAASAQLKAIYEQRQRSDKARDSGTPQLMVHLLARHHAALQPRVETTSAHDKGTAIAPQVAKREINWPMLLLAGSTVFLLLKLFAWWFYK